MLPIIFMIMGSNFFDIPFLTRSSASDFACKDGELSNAEGNFFIGSPEASIPVADVTFAIQRDILKGWHSHPDLYPTKSLVASEASMESYTNLASQLLTAYVAETRQQNLFVAPFLVTAAWKTTSGTYIGASSPSLMIPNSDVPLVATDSDISSEEPAFKIAGAVCSLRLKMKAGEALRDWVGKITALEIFTSGPLQSYDSFLSFLPQRRVTTDAWCRCLDPETGLITDRRICTETLPLAWKATVKGKLASVTAQTGFLPDSDVIKGLKFYSFASISLSEVDLIEDWTGSDSGIGDWHRGIMKEMTFDSIINSSSDLSKSYPTFIEGTGEEIDVETRPMKLSGAGILKRAIYFRLRGTYDPEALTMSVYASRDMLKWWCVGKRKGGTVVSVARVPFRFFKVRIEGKLEKGFRLEGLSIKVSVKK